MAKVKTKTVRRCAWAEGDGARPQDLLMRAYHDEEWGVPIRDGRALWELLMLEGFQAGLSWQIILRKREGFRRAFKGFEPKVVARFGEKDVARLMGDEGIVRARAKIDATIAGARIYCEMEKEGEGFAEWAWGLVGGTAGAEFLGPEGRRSWAGTDSGVDGDVREGVEGIEEEGLQVCGAGDCVLVDAGGGDGE